MFYYSVIVGIGGVYQSLVFFGRRRKIFKNVCFAAKFLRVSDAFVAAESDDKLIEIIVAYIVVIEGGVVVQSFYFQISVPAISRYAAGIIFVLCMRSV